VVGHEDEREGAGEGDGRGERPCKEIEHGDGEGSEDQRDDTKVPFGFGEGIELVGEDEEERRMKIRGIFFIKFYLALEIIPGVVEGMDFIHPQRFFVEGIKSQCETDEEAKNQNNNFFLL
jgi:hypothetical protein